MGRFVFAFLAVAAVIGQTRGQSTAFVLNGGLSVGFQKWDNSFDRQPLYKYHEALSMESVNNDNDNSTVLAQFGNNIRGSATRFRFLFQGGGIGQFSEEFIFRNLSLVLGGKKKFPLGARSKTFVYAGVRGDYTLSTNVDELAGDNIYTRIYYPQVGFVNRRTAGVSIGGGLELPFGELVGAQLMASVHPDFLYQYDQPPLPNVIDPFNPGQNTTIPERRIRNVTIEISLGLRLLRKVVYEE